MRNAIAAAMIATTVASASASASVRTMTLDEALSYARAHQPALKSALARVAAAAADARVPRAQWLPSFGATVQAFEATTNTTTASYVGVPDVDLPRIGSTKVGTPSAGSGAAWKPNTSLLGAVGGGQEVFDFGRIAAQAAVTDLSYEAEKQRADAERLRLDLLVKDAYYGVLGAHAVLRAAQDAFQRAKVHRDMAAAGVRSGLHAPIELTRAEADLTRFDVGQIRADGSVRSAEAVFAAAVGVDESLLDAGGEAPPVAPAPPLMDAFKQASQVDPVLRAGRFRADAADALTRAIAAEIRPDLALTATFSGRGGTAPPSGSTSDQYDLFPPVPNWDVGLVLRWPFYDPIVEARRRASAARAEAARADLAVLVQQESATIQEAYVSLEASQAALVSLGRAVEAAHANYAQAEARFKAGLGTSLELADAEAVRTDAEIQLAVGEFDTRRARAALSRLLAEDL